MMIIIKFLKINIVILFVPFFYLTINGANIERSDYQNIHEHPRLILNKNEQGQLIHKIQNDSIAYKYHSEIIKYANGLIDKPLLERKLIGKRLLDVSRNALRRIFYLSYAHRCTGDSDFSQRAIDEILNVCGYKDWNPQHFIDVGEMVMGVAIGYDWLYDQLNIEQRKIIAEAIKEKGLIPSLNDKVSKFSNTYNNWNSVCNAGLVYGAISIIDLYPDLSKQIIERCLLSNPKVLSRYGVNGGFIEGYNYWEYGTVYEVMLLDVLKRTFGDYLLSLDGFKNAWKYRLFMSAPTGMCSNFSDSSSILTSSIAMWWFADMLNDQSLLFIEKYLIDQNISFAATQLLPLVPISLSRIDKFNIKEPTDHFWSDEGFASIFVYRGGWKRKNDTYLAVKGGSPSIPHGHMDAGSFIFEYNGIRWAMDLGIQDYHSLESKGVKIWDSSQDGQRWDVMRMRNDCHNTLTVDSGRHIVKAKAEIIDTFNSVNRKGALVDLTSTLGKVKKAHREVSLDKNDYLSVIDSIETGENQIQLTWVMVTPADAEIADPSNIILRKDGRSMKLSIHSPVEVEARRWENAPMHNYDAENKGSIRVGYTTVIPANSNVALKVILSHCPN